MLIEFGEAPAGANGVDVALGENGAQPGLQRAASVEIAEERALTALRVGETVKIREGESARSWAAGGVRGATQDRGGGGTKVGAIFGDEIFPGLSMAFGAGGREGQVLQMQRTKIFLDLVRGDTLRGEAFRGAAFEGGFKRSRDKDQEY